jgi:hypothetical protein
MRCTQTQVLFCECVSSPSPPLIILPRCTRCRGEPLNTAVALCIRTSQLAARPLLRVRHVPWRARVKARRAAVTRQVSVQAMHQPARLLQRAAKSLTTPATWCAATQPRDVPLVVAPCGGGWGVRWLRLTACHRSLPAPVLYLRHLHQKVLRWVGSVHPRGGHRLFMLACSTQLSRDATSRPPHRVAVVHKMLTDAPVGTACVKTTITTSTAQMSQSCARPLPHGAPTTVVHWKKSCAVTAPTEKNALQAQSGRGSAMLPGVRCPSGVCRVPPSHKAVVAAGVAQQRALFPE